MALNLPFGISIGRPRQEQPPEVNAVPYVPQPPQDVDEFTEIGAVGTVSYSGFLDQEEYVPELRGAEAVKTYTRMGSDGMVKGILRTVTLPLREATLQVKPVSDDEKDAQIAEACEWILTNMDGMSYDDFARQALMGGTQYGFAVFEPVWVNADGEPNIVEHNGLQLLAPFKLAPRLQKTIYRWFIDRFGELKGIQQLTFVSTMDPATDVQSGNTGGSFRYGTTGSYYYIDINVDRLLVFSFERKGADFLGESVLRSAYKHFYYKDNILRMMAVGIERHMVGTPYAVMKSGIAPREQSALINTLRTYRSHEKAYMLVNENQLANATNIGMPPLGIMQMPSLGSNGKLADTAINYHDRQMAISIVADFLSLGSGIGGNANVMSRDKTSYFYLALQGFGHNYTNTLDVLIKKFVDINWPGYGKYPKSRLMGLEAKDLDRAARGIAQLIQVGGITPDAGVENMLRDLLGLPLLPEDADGNPIKPEPVAPPVNPDTGQPEPPVSAGGGGSLSEKLLRLAESTGTQGADALQKKTAQQIRDNAARLVDDEDEYDETDFVDEGHGLLKGAYLSSFLLGASVKARSGRTPSGTGVAADTWASTTADAQRGYLDGFANDVKAGAVSEAEIGARADMYAGPVWTGFQRGRVASSEDGANITWHAEGDDATCELCSARDGETYTEDSLPGFPGEGGFGEICDGGPNCRCWLDIAEPEQLHEKPHKNGNGHAKPRSVTIQRDQDGKMVGFEVAP